MATAVAPLEEGMVRVIPPKPEPEPEALSAGSLVGATVKLAVTVLTGTSEGTSADSSRAGIVGLSTGSSGAGEKVGGG